ncbi:type II secretion system secretin GspD [Pantoea sp. 1.19]|uniref:type II secretion system secretin GspD n=1 Tax=Pantoea sp. 1.19 TaxID=1925589 RepID=UPI000948C78E|nr:type II secretion system secretin GspD [Pantoea sp. 1.19]
MTFLTLLLFRVRLLKRRICGLLLLLLMFITTPLCAEAYRASFNKTDISEFISTVSKNLKKTIIIDPEVKGSISVRSEETLSDAQYYQFFLSVLEVYGFAVIEMPDEVLKVIPGKKAKNGVRPLMQEAGSHPGDALVSRVIPLRYITARELAPLLRELNDAATGSVVHYDPGNVILMTGRAAAIEQLTAIVESVDVPEDSDVETLTLENASAPEVAEIVNSLHADQQKSGKRAPARAVADQRTNTLLITGEAVARQHMIDTVLALDGKSETRSHAKVIYLKHAKARNLLEVLTGISGEVDNHAGQGSAARTISLLKDRVVKADEHTNSLIIQASPTEMNNLESIIHQLDIDRAQVLVEGIIVEVQDADGLGLGVQWFNKYGGGTQFPGAGTPVSDLSPRGMAASLGKFNGLAAGFYRGNWAGLFTALQTNSQNNILATPSIVTLDNMEAEFTVGQDVPVLTGSQTTSGDNLYQTVSRRSVGIKLKVKPQINQGNSVMLEIEQEVSSVAEEASKDNLGPTFNTRSVRNAVLVSNGSTVVVGGLLDNSSSQTQHRVPLLGRLPLIGPLFRYQSDKRAKRNLMLFIRPTIMRTQPDYAGTSATQRDKFTASLADDHTAEALRQRLDPPRQPGQSNHAVRDTQRLIADFYRVTP